MCWGSTALLLNTFYKQHTVAESGSADSVSHSQAAMNKANVIIWN